MRNRDTWAPQRGLPALLMAAALALVLAGCGRSFNDSGAEADLVFVNQSNTQIFSVVLQGRDFESRGQNADNSPLDRDESLGFEVDGYPVTITVYSGINGGGAVLASGTIGKGPPVGMRWYVRARDGVEELYLSTISQPTDEKGQSGKGFQVFPWVLLWGPLLVLVAAALVCIICLPKGRRKGLLTATVAVGVCAAVLFGGVWLLRGYGLSWRTVPLEVLCTLTWGTGLAAGVLTVRYVPRWVKEHIPPLAVWAQALTLYCLISVMIFGSFLGLFWAALVQDTGGERVGAYEGQRVVQVTSTWLGDTSYQLYEYHGPLVRGTESLAVSMEPFLEE